MNTRILTAAAFLALALAPSLASANDDGNRGRGETIAVEACMDVNEYGPADLIQTVDDGMGDYLVWLEDAEGDLWACNASADGDVYVNAFVLDDLLEGEGGDMFQLVGGPGGRNPAKRAERLCVAVADGDLDVVATVEDGLGDYLVWLEADDGTFIMCNASSDGKLYAFEAVDMPINAETSEEESDDASDDLPATPVVQQPGRPSGQGNTQFG